MYILWSLTTSRWTVPKMWCRIYRLMAGWTHTGAIPATSRWSLLTNCRLFLIQKRRLHRRRGYPRRNWGNKHLWPKNKFIISQMQVEVKAGKTPTYTNCRVTGYLSVSGWGGRLKVKNVYLVSSITSFNLFFFPRVSSPTKCAFNIWGKICRNQMKYVFPFLNW